MKDYSKEEAEILKAIESYEGIPTALALSKKGNGPLPYGHKFVLNRLKSNQSLQKALNKKGLTYINELSEDAFSKLVTQKEMSIGSLPEKLQEAVYKKFDEIILREIQNYEGIPTARALSKEGNGPLPHSAAAISSCINTNPSLKEALNKRGLEYIDNLTEDEFNKFITKVGTIGNAPKNIQNAIYKRADSIIKREIQNFKGIPTARSLSKTGKGPLLYGKKFISNRLKANPELCEALNKRGLGYIESSTEKEFNNLITKHRTIGNAPKNIQNAIYKRADSIIKREIQNFKGIPTAKALSKEEKGPLPYSDVFVSNRIKANSLLQEAQKKRGSEHINILTEKAFNKLVSKEGNIGALQKNFGAAIYKRADEIILREIQNFKGIPTARPLSKTGKGPLPYSGSFILNRINTNPELYEAFYLKRGLTPDQINALKVEQLSQSTSSKESLRNRLKNMRIFREALAIVREFSDMLNEKILEISFYPEPLKKAFEFEDMEGEVSSSELQPFRSNSKTKLSYPNGEFSTILVQQGAHRMKAEELTNLLFEVNRVLKEDGMAFVTIPAEYSFSVRFGGSIQSVGMFSMESGALFTQALTKDELEAIGIEDASRIKEKVEQETNVHLLRKMEDVEKGDGILVEPPLREPRKNGEGEFHPSLEEINTPDEVLRKMEVVYQKGRQDISVDAFILTILDKDRKECEVIGYNMNSKKPKEIEFDVGSKKTLGRNELVRIAKILMRPEGMGRLFIKMGRETKMTANCLRKKAGLKA